MSETQANRALPELLLEIRDEFLQFVETRLRLFAGEWQEEKARLRRSIPLMIGAAVLLGTAYLLLMAALVAIVAQAFPDSQLRWIFSFAIVGGLWLLMGLVAASRAWRAAHELEEFPKKTISVLRADGIWLEETSSKKTERTAA
jgi:uncharacterized membrane protein YqjE